MTVETWIAYLIASALLSLIPGPSVLMVIGQALNRGRRGALTCVFGDVCGGMVGMTASYLGLGLILASSALAFAVMKWVGVAYMAYLGISQLRAARHMTDVALPQHNTNTRGSLGAGFLTGVLNPKAIMFNMAFLAQFINPTEPPLPQFLILVATSTCVVAAILGSYGLLAVRASRSLTNLKARRRMGYAGGSMLLGGSAVMAVTR